MIINFMIVTLITLVKSIFFIFPTLPATPSAVSSAGAWVTDTIASVTSVLQMIFGSTLLTAIILVIVGIFGMETIYNTIMWILRKIPVINVK
jgi:hypothetical protein